MDIRYTTNPYIDMDDLAKPWEINRKLSIENIDKEYLKKGSLKEITSLYYSKKEEEQEKQEVEEISTQLRLKLK